jgi:hypothetical protein
MRTARSGRAIEKIAAVLATSLCHPLDAGNIVKRDAFSVRSTRWCFAFGVTRNRFDGRLVKVGLMHTDAICKVSLLNIL